VGDGTVPDYRDGRDIRAFTPIFDGLLPGHDKRGCNEFLLLLRRRGRLQMARRRRASAPHSTVSRIVLHAWSAPSRKSDVG